MGTFFKSLVWVLNIPAFLCGMYVTFPSAWYCRYCGSIASPPFSQVRAHQLVLPPCEVVIKAVSEYVSSIKDLGNLDAVARDVFKQSQVSARTSAPVYF